ncbi:hypothetical protein ANANG_G00253430 [Anguilla anguilla]|uniref:Uncharacterized protein n=1 Tax=Anguilla anguilla TaxID=7936 RepID=A0A9D3LSQ6_ANGAN|nr:hypothetical protein ANANG_G00253430 [Anguilla anguilla]
MKKKDNERAAALEDHPLTISWLIWPGSVYRMRTRNMVKSASTNRAMMYFLYFFQMKKMKVFIGFTNQLKEVLGRLERGGEKVRS